ncbi:hypothetical protein DVH05_001460 [Phytophthora capsici]|nr:hypothetical protein DVH05_001460 [Phytophthora capsici]
MMTHKLPPGTVAKKDVVPKDEVRLTDDLSYPPGGATNDASYKAGFPNVDHKRVVTVVRRIEDCAKRFPANTISILKGDVKGAFRHLMLAREHVRWMGARIPQLNACRHPLAGQALQLIMASSKVRYRD